MESLPPYQASQESPAVSASGHAGTNSTAASNASNPVALPPGDPLGLIGGSGVRLPLTSDERVRFDRRVCARLRTFGTYTRANASIPTDSPLRAETFRPEDLYQSAASQLDVLLPALSPTTLPATTALRTITLRIDTPFPDVNWETDFTRTGPVQGRAILSKAFKSWMGTFVIIQKKGEQALYEAADAITGRLAMEGFLVLEEWWDPRRGLLMLTVRC